MINSCSIKGMDRSLIPLLYTAMDVEGERMLCPWCQGGEHNEMSFTISKKHNGFVYNCYRDSCRQAYPSVGFYGTDTSAASDLKPCRKPLKQFMHPTQLLSAAQAALFMREFRLTRDDISHAGIVYGPTIDRFVFPIRGPFGEHRGVVARSYDPAKRKQKTINYKEVDAPFSHWEIAEHNDILVLVEDFVSAQRVFKLGYSCIALLGTHLPDLTVIEMQRYAPEKVIIALDADARDKARKLNKQINVFFPKVQVAWLEKDIKDMEYDHSIREVLGVL